MSKNLHLLCVMMRHKTTKLEYTQKNMNDNKIIGDETKFFNLDTSDALWTEAEAAKKLKIGQSTLQRHRLCGEISFFRVGNQIRYNNEQIDAYLSRCRRGFK